jgi:DNA-binding LacI/PurR family transcriptional regulator
MPETALIVSEKDASLIEEIAAGDLPAVFDDVGVPGPHFTNIRTDYFRGTQGVVEYLYATGHRRMAFVGHHERAGAPWVGWIGGSRSRLLGPFAERPGPLPTRRVTE